MVFNAAGDLLVADYTNYRVRIVWASTLKVYVYAGTGVAGSGGDGGAATSAQLAGPYALALDATGNLYIADFVGNAVRKVLKASPYTITTYAGTGTSGYAGDGGAATSATLTSPSSVAVDASGNLFIADQGNNVVRKVARTTGIISTVAGSGAQGDVGDAGPATAALFTTVSGLAVDGGGNLYILDSGANRVRYVIAGTGYVAAFVGTGATNRRRLSTAAFSSPSAIVYDPSTEGFYVADTGNNAIRTVSPSSVPTHEPTTSPLANVQSQGRSLTAGVFDTASGAPSSTCPRACSGRGTCLRAGAVARCTCYPGFIGIDCALRVCPSARGWVDHPTGNNTAHADYAECSNMGTCNRATGACTCRSGFAGPACEQMICPLGTSTSVSRQGQLQYIPCGGHGQCKSLREINANPDYVTSFTSRVYNGWDADRIMGCVCDPRWKGLACEYQTCPMGDDPGTPGVDEVQVRGRSGGWPAWTRARWYIQAHWCPARPYSTF